MLDVTVGAHYRAGESLVDTLRETEEEIGLTVDLGGLIPLGVRVGVNEVPEHGIYDRELQDVFLLIDDRPLTAYRPHPAELAELVRMPLDRLIASQREPAITVDAVAIAPGEPEPRPVTIGPGDFVPTIDRYVLRLAVAARRVLAGEGDVLI